MSERTIGIGEVFISGTFAVTAVKFFTPYIVCLEIVPRLILNSCSGSNLNLLDITID